LVRDGPNDLIRISDCENFINNFGYLRMGPFYLGGEAHWMIFF
jgi:hypothetical protein